MAVNRGTHGTRGTQLRRRDVLRAALGATMAGLVLPGCRGARGVPDGELVDLGRPRAHAALRDAPPPATLFDTAPRRRAEVVVVGSGIAGLSAAWRLRRAGLEDLAILELDDSPGGTAQSRATDVTAFPLGAHYVVTPGAEYPAFTALLDELGVLEGVDQHGRPRPREEHACREPEERHFREGRFFAGLYPLHGETADERAQRLRFTRQMRALVASRDASGRRLFALPTARASVGAEAQALDRMSFAAWLTQEGFTSWRLRWLCDYACRDDYGCALEQTSARAGLLYFCARRDDPPAPPGAADASSDAEGVDDGRTIITWPEGNGRVVQHLAGPLGDRIHTRHVVVGIDDGVGAEVEVRTLSPDGPVVWRAPHVVLAVPDFVARRLVPGCCATSLPPVPTSSWAVVNLHLERRPSDRGRAFASPMPWDTVFTESASLGYVVATHQTGRDHGPTVLTWYRPLTEGTPKEARMRLEALSRSDWAEAALAEIALAHPDIRDVVTRVDVARFGHAMARPEPGLWAARLAVPAHTSSGRVLFAHTDRSVLALCEEAFFHGVRAAEELMSARGQPVRSML